MATLDEGDDPLEPRAVGTLAAETVAVAHVHLVLVALQQRLPGPRGQGPPGGVHVEAEVVTEGGHRALEVLGGLGALGPGGDGPLTEGGVLVGDDEVRVHLQLDAEAGARGAGAEGRVEGEGARLDLVDVERVVVGAGHRLGVAPLASGVVLVEVDEVDDEDPAGEAERGLHRVGEALLARPVSLPLRHEAVDDDVDGVLDLLLQGRRLGERDRLAVHARTAVPLGPQLGEEIDELALARPDDRREDLESGALRQLEQAVDDLLGALPRDRLAADGAVRAPDPREEEAQVVVHLGDRADRRAGVAVRRLLVDGHRRGEPLDEVDIRLVHLPEELPGIGGERLDIATLTLGEDRVEGERGLARPGESREDDERVPRDVDVDVLEIVLAGTLDDDPVVEAGAGGLGNSHPPHLRRRPRQPSPTYRSPDPGPPSLSG